MLLTLLHREGEIWSAHLRIAPEGSSSGPARLEFERSGGGPPARVGCALPSSLMDALQGGRALSRGRLEQELERALVESRGPGSADP